jgi:hypothetical protein
MLRVISHADMPALLEQHKLLGESFTVPFVVLRLLTPRGVKYDDAVRRYKPYGTLKMPLPQMLAAQAVSHGRRPYVLVNNRTEGSAPRTVQVIVDMLAVRQAGRQDLGYVHGFQHPNRYCSYFSTISGGRTCAAFGSPPVSRRARRWRKRSQH